jgi:hypothetical protein
MSNPRPLTRQDLAKFLPDQRAIKAFEELFRLVPEQLDVVDTDAGTALAASASASAMAQRGIQISRSNQVLLWLSI